MKTIASLAALVLVGSTLVGACGGDVRDDAVTVQKTRDGDATGDGHTCSWDNVTERRPESGVTVTASIGDGPYEVGDTFLALDGCNECSCTAQGISCTGRSCTGTCTYDGRSYPANAGFQDTGDCNACTCAASGGVICQLVKCDDRCPTKKLIACASVVPPERMRLCEGPYHDWIVAHCDATFVF